jgi:hypothetical protein
MACAVTVPAKAAREYAGEVIHVSGKGEDEHKGLDGYTKDFVGRAGKQTFEVEVKLIEEDEELRPHFRAEVEFLLDTVEGVLVVPWGAVRRSSSGDYATVVEKGRPVTREVKLGPSDETSVVIQSGCSEGETVLLAHGST